MPSVPSTPAHAPTPANRWKMPEAEVVDLPSGNTVRLQRPQILPMLRSGSIPNPLREAALLAADDTGQVNGEIGSDSVDAGDVADFLAWCVSNCFLEPPVVVVGDNKELGETPEAEIPEGAIRYDQLTDADIVFVTAWWRGGTAALDTFPGFGAGDQDGGDRRQVGDTTVDAARD